MVATPYPLPRELRESAILVGNGTAGPYGPSTYKIFDVADVEVLIRPAGEAGFTLTDDVTVTKTSGLVFDTFSVEFNDAIPDTTEWQHRSSRTHERSVSVFKGGAIQAALLEAELTRIATVISETRRDINRAFRLASGTEGSGELPALDDGHTMMWDEDLQAFVQGPSAADIVAATPNATLARLWASRTPGEVVDATNYPGLYSSRGYAALAAAIRDATAVYRDFAAQWASDPEDGDPIDDGVNPPGQSARHWERKAYAQFLAAQAIVSGLSLPPIVSGDASKMLHAKADESGLELRTAAQSRIWLGIPFANHADRATTRASFEIPGNLSIRAAVAANALTVSIKGLDGTDPSATNPVLIPFPRSDGDIDVISITAANALTISSGSTLGTVSGEASRLWVVLFDDAGTYRLGLVNCLSGTSIMALRNGVYSSTAEGGAGAADSAQVIYTGTAVTSKDMVVLGYVEITEATAGTWATGPTKVHTLQPGDWLPGQVVQWVRTQTGASSTGTTAIPGDDTIPQNTEGDQHLSQAIVVTSGANLLDINSRVHLSGSTTSWLTSALFQDSVANALAVGQIYMVAGTPVQISISHVKKALSPGSTTLKVRDGPSTGTMTFNGYAGSRIMGGTQASYLDVREIMA